MKRLAIAAIAGVCAMAGAAMAQEEGQGQECVLEKSAPDMPNPKKATAEDRAAIIAAIKEYQAALADYRACLDAVSGNEDLDVDVRQKAIDDFNASVEAETKMVEAWQKFDKKYQKSHK